MGNQLLISNMITQKTDFDYSALDPEEPATPSAVRREERQELARQIMTQLLPLIIAKINGKLPPGRTIAARTVSLMLYFGAEERTLEECAKEIGGTAAWLSKLCIMWAGVFKEPAHWQRPYARSSYAERQRGVAAGTWIATDATQRRKLNKKLKERRALTTNAATHEGSGAI